MADPRRSADSIVVKCEIRDGAAVVTPVGDVDLTASPVLRQELKKVQGSRPQRLIVDLSQVPYMDSSGVATLVEAMKTANQNRTRLVLCGMQPKVRSIFEIARLDTVFAIVADTNQALTH
jgi:anti-sigma B factor antagonist